LEPLSLHPQNPHYFLFRGQPAVLITAGEHYGAVINLDFDYIAYLDELAAQGFNLTRTFTGTYVEYPGSPVVASDENPLGPRSERLVTPWARSSTPGYSRGGNKFDLTRWDDRYFSRLRDFVAQAGRRGIVVEIVLFSNMYFEEVWGANPMNARNNVNGIGGVPLEQVYSTENHGRLLEVQDAVVRKIVTELSSFDNVYYELINEPPAGVRPWEDHITSTIVQTESALGRRHLIAKGVGSINFIIGEHILPHPDWSIYNYHYSSLNGVRNVTDNYDIDKVIAFDETGFQGTDPEPYRIEAWNFILAGGAVYDLLDASFTISDPRGTGASRWADVHAGGPAVREQLRILKEFIHSFEFSKLAPNDGILGSSDEDAHVRVLAEPGRAYALYIQGGRQVDLDLEIPSGAYEAEWINTKTGVVKASVAFDHQGGSRRISSPPYERDIALRILAR
jgi:hypothetical protein